MAVNYRAKPKTSKGGLAMFLLGALAMVVAAIMIIGCFVGWWNFGKADKPAGEQQETLPPLDGDGNEMKTDGTAQAMPKSMTFRAALNSDDGISAQAGTSVTLTAKIEPADADNQLVDWEVSYKDGSSGAATCVNVTPSSDGSLTATVINYAAFSKQIVIKVTSRDNPSVSASCTCDYLAALTGVDVSLTNGGTVNKIVIGDGKTYKANATPKFGVGTITPQTTVTFGSELGNDSDGQNMDATKSFTYAIMMNGWSAGIQQINVFESKDNFVCTTTWLKQFANQQMLTMLGEQRYFNGFKKAVAVCTDGNHFYVSVTVAASYNGTELNTVTNKKGYKFDAAAMTISVTGITLDEELLFGL